MSMKKPPSNDVLDGDVGKFQAIAARSAMDALKLRD
jgi:hypothetical protein